MLPKQFRLKRSTLFTKTLSSGKACCRVPCFLLLGLPRLPHATQPLKVGFVVSKKVSNRAHHRNKVRRRLRELVRLQVLSHEGCLKSSYAALVFIARPPILAATYADLQQHILAWMKKEC